MRVRKDGIVSLTHLPNVNLFCNNFALLEPDDGRPPKLISCELLDDCLSPEHAYRASEEEWTA